jgi:hypothetical protein
MHWTSVLGSLAGSVRGLVALLLDIHVSAVTVGQLAKEGNFKHDFVFISRFPSAQKSSQQMMNLLNQGLGFHRLSCWVGAAFVSQDTRFQVIG